MPMLLTKLMAAGLGSGLANAFCADTADSQTATGTNQATAFETSTAFVRFTTVASGTGCLLDNGARGDSQYIVNAGASTLSVYPHVGGSINALGTNAAFSIPAGSWAAFDRYTDTLWTANNNAATSSFVQSGTGALTRTVSATLAAITRTGDYNTTANFNTATVALTETIGVSGIQTGQTAESVAKALWTHRWVTSGQPPFEIHNVSAPNTGGGAGTYNHAVFFGYNVGRHSTGAVTANKPALIMGMEDNYYDDGGDNTYGSEWYVEHYSSDGTTVPLLRPFYTRVRNANNTDSSCTTLFNIGTDGTGQFDVRAGVTTSLLNIVPTAFTVGTSKGVAFKVTGSASPNANYIQITAGASGGGASIAAVGETDVAMALSSKGTGGIVFYTNSFNDAQVQVLPTAGATRNLRLTGSNGGNPTISVSAGNLAITPAIVAASSITTGTPSGGTSGAWKFGVAAVVSPTSPNRTIELDVGGTIYYLHAKTTNN